MGGCRQDFCTHRENGSTLDLAGRRDAKTGRDGLPNFSQANQFAGV